MGASKKTRPATVDSIFYPGNEEDLKKAVEGYLDDVSVSRGTARVVLAPHAGYEKTGRLMASAYLSAAERRIERAVILSRVHREPEKAVFLPTFSSYSTPLGEIPVDKKCLEKFLESDPVFRYDDIPHVEEHSIEVQLPFIQTLWPEASIVPVLTGKPLLSLSKILSKTIGNIMKESMDGTLFIVSSNLSAYDHGNEAVGDAELFLKLLGEGKWTDFPQLLDKREISACSADCLTAMYFLFDGRLHFNILDKDYGNTENLSGKRVCFGAISFD